MMKRLILAALALAICFSTFADARGRSGTHRSGGYGSHGKGSHYR
jgi:hypothetical protein